MLENTNNLNEFYTRPVDKKDVDISKGNWLFFGDNLNILKEHIPDESVDLIYLDPPFNSKADYNILFKNPSGEKSDAQIVAFEDTWQWNEHTMSEFHEILKSGNSNVSELINYLEKFLGKNDMMAYLVMMTNRLLQLHRVLKSTGSIYLHCDSTASHYLKIIMDAIFKNYFRNEIVWHYSGWNKKLNSHFEKRHDTILFYSKSENSYFNSYTIPYESKEEYIKIRKQKVYVDENGKEYTIDTRNDGNGGKRVTNIYVEESVARGKPIDDVWKIDKLNNSSKESLGYPTQKPLALLERIIESSSDKDFLILDPFCGCGTTIHASEKLNRRWIGIDITHLAITLIEKRLKDAFPEIKYNVYGTPKDFDSAKNLALRDAYQFQWWACSLVNAIPYQNKKKGADTGIDGYIYFVDDKTGSPKKCIVSVKSGKNIHVNSIRELTAVVQREKAEIGFFITLQEPTSNMIAEAVGAGYYESEFFNNKYLRIQILTIEDLMSGKVRAEYPNLMLDTIGLKKAQKESSIKGKQENLFNK